MTSAADLARFLEAAGATLKQEYTTPDQWIEANYYIKESPDSTVPIRLLPHQKGILRFALQRDPITQAPRFNTVLYSTIKKSGKTAISGAVGRWVAETWGPYQDVVFVGNDKSQAVQRGFASVKESIELTPGYHRGRQELPERWRVLTDRMAHLVSGSIVRAVATDFTGEAGANPTLSVWTELWGFVNRNALRFWAELTPSPTRPTSIRWIETYAGYEGESELLWGLYDSTVESGRQLTAGEMKEAVELYPGELGDLFNQPDDGLVPCYVNEGARMFAYWDQGMAARRMPWQQGDRGRQYYIAEAATQTDSQMRRLHANEWVSAESSFIPIERWDQLTSPLPLVPGDRTPLIIALDAAVTGDCFGMVVVSRDPRNRDQGVAERASYKWEPHGEPLDFAPVEEQLRWFFGQTWDQGTRQWVQSWQGFNVAQVCYDPYQLHDFSTRLRREGLGWFKEFSQGIDRLKADKGLRDLIIQGNIRHGGNPDLRQHLTNANAKQSKDEDTRLRIVKKSAGRHIDLVVCLSMAAYECLRLNL